MKFTKGLVLVAMLSASLLVGCGKKGRTSNVKADYSTPEKTFATFVDAARANDSVLVCECISYNGKHKKLVNSAFEVVSSAVHLVDKIQKTYPEEVKKMLEKNAKPSQVPFRFEDIKASIQANIGADKKSALLTSKYIPMIPLPMVKEGKEWKLKLPIKDKMIDTKSKAAEEMLPLVKNVLDNVAAKVGKKDETLNTLMAYAQLEFAKLKTKFEKIEKKHAKN